MFQTILIFYITRILHGIFWNEFDLKINYFFFNLTIFLNTLRKAHDINKFIASGYRKLFLSYCVFVFFKIILGFRRNPFDFWASWGRVPLLSSRGIFGPLVPIDPGRASQGLVYIDLNTYSSYLFIQFSSYSSPWAHSSCLVCMMPVQYWS